MVKIGNIKASNIPCKIFVLDICERHCVNTGAIKTQTSHLTPRKLRPQKLGPETLDPENIRCSLNSECYCTLLMEGEIIMINGWCFVL